MGKLTTTYANRVIQHLFDVYDLSQPTIYVALSTTDPASSVTEPSGNGYARKAHAAWEASSSTGEVRNNGNIAFSLATGSWGTITHWALYDASTSGNLLGYGELTSSRNPQSGDVVVIADETLKVAVL